MDIIAQGIFFKKGFQTIRDYFRVYARQFGLDRVYTNVYTLK